MGSQKDPASPFSWSLHQDEKPSMGDMPSSARSKPLSIFCGRGRKRKKNSVVQGLFISPSPNSKLIVKTHCSGDREKLYPLQPFILKTSLVYLTALNSGALRGFRV